MSVNLYPPRQVDPAPSLSDTSESSYGLALLGLQLDHFFAPPATGNVGTPVLIDKDGDAQITLEAGTALKSMYFSTNTGATLGIKLGSGITLSTTTIQEGSVISVDGVALGKVTYYDGYEIDFQFNAATTSATIEAQRLATVRLIHALTYARHDADQYSFEGSITLAINDTNNASDAVQVFAADRILGDETDNTFELYGDYLSQGDEVIGGAGHDTLKLSGPSNFVDLSVLSKFESIETIQGSGNADFIRILATQIQILDKIDGGGQETDYLSISGDTIDLRGKTITGFKSILYDGVGTVIIVDTVALAKILDGTFAVDEKLTIANGVVSDADRLALHRNGIDIVINNGRTTNLSDIANKSLKGTTGKNALKGSLGNDKLYGDYGNDTLTGGYGSDVFVFNSKLGTYKTDRIVNFDTITDFSTVNDHIYLENAIFKSLKRTGTLSKSFFKVGTQAADKDDFILYNKATGYLSYDADGSGSKYKPIEFAKLSKNLKMAYDDFKVI